jgi:predicted alpha/beta superfamily hydrolase
MRAGPAACARACALAALLHALAAPAAPARHVVRFEIDLRAEIAAGRFDPRTDRAGVRGSQLPLSWEVSAPAEDADGDGIHTASVAFERAPFGDQPVAYKFKLERAAEPDAGWEPGRNHPLRLGAPQQRVRRAFGAAATTLPPRRTGRIDRLRPIASAHVDAREVQVWLPPGYASEPHRRYPVLYLHDGQNVFDGRAAVAEWMVDETAQRLVQSRAIGPLIVVAVASTARRVDDYTSTRTAHGGGGAVHYARYLVEELKPAIDARYRTRTDARHTAVGGASLGGLVTMWLLLHRADTFGAGLVVSPAAWWDDQRIVRDVAAWSPAARPRLWLDIGGREGAEAVAGARALRDALGARGWEVTFTEDAEASHDEAAWAARVEAMLRFLDAGFESSPRDRGHVRTSGRTR